jgi:hypothetical protein
LGLIFDPFENKFSSETRSGKTLNLALSLTRVWFFLEKVIVPKHWLVYPLYMKLCETIETKVEK